MSKNKGRKAIKKPKQTNAPYMKSMALNNPIQNVPVKSNSPGLPGFTFAGGIF